MGTPKIMRVLSHLLLVLAVLVAGCATLIYSYLTSLARGYAPNSSGCRALPWELQGEERFWLVGLPISIVVALVALARLARNKARQRGD